MKRQRKRKSKKRRRINDIRSFELYFSSLSPSKGASSDAKIRARTFEPLASIQWFFFSKPPAPSLCYSVLFLHQGKEGPFEERGGESSTSATNLEKAKTLTPPTASMPSPRALVALAVALLAASTGKVPLLSPPVKAVLSFVLPASLGGGSGGVFSSGGDVADDRSTGGGHLRANRLLSIALRNATSDYDEVRIRMVDLLEKKAGQVRGFRPLVRGRRGFHPTVPAARKKKTSRCWR